MSKTPVARSSESLQNEGKSHAERELELETLQIDNLEKSPNGANEVYIVSLEDGSKAIFKPADGEKAMDRSGAVPGTYYQRERAAYLVSEKLGFDLVPPTVIRTINGRVGSLQDFVEVDNDTSIDDELLKGELFKLWILDYLDFTSDRTRSNTLVENNKLVAIDNGLTFGQDYTFYFRKFWEQPVPAELTTILENVTTEIRDELSESLSELLSPKEVSAFISRLENVKNTAASRGYFLPQDFSYFNPATKEGKIDSEVGTESYQADKFVQRQYA